MSKNDMVHICVNCFSFQQNRQQTEGAKCCSGDKDKTFTGSLRQLRPEKCAPTQQ